MIPPIPSARTNLRLLYAIAIDCPKLGARDTALLVRQLLPVELNGDVAGIEVFASAKRLVLSTADVVARLPGDLGDRGSTGVADEEEVAVVTGFERGCGGGGGGGRGGERGAEEGSEGGELHDERLVGVLRFWLLNEWMFSRKEA